MKSLLIIALLFLPTCAAAQEAIEEPVTPSSVVAHSKAEEWKPIDPADLLVMDLATDPLGRQRRVVIQLVPPPFSESWVANIRKLAKAHWWDGTSVYRVVDNWVTQWGDVEETKALPHGVPEIADDTYAIPRAIAHNPALDRDLSPANEISQWASFFQGFPVAGTGGPDVSLSWPTHCYGSVGVARSVGSGGTGSELYAVIGQAPRQLDRNIAVVGRVIEGIEHLSTLPRGPSSTNGVYEDAAQRVPIIAVRLGTELPEPPHFEYLASDSQSFADYVHIRANRHDAFYLHQARRIDVCNVQPPVRRVGAE